MHKIFIIYIGGMLLLLLLLLLLLFLLLLFFCLFGGFQYHPYFVFEVTNPKESTCFKERMYEGIIFGVKEGERVKKNIRTETLDISSSSFLLIIYEPLYLSPYLTILPHMRYRATPTPPSHPRTRPKTLQYHIPTDL